MTAAELVVRAHGHPAKQGSKGPKGHVKGRCILVEMDKKLPEWRATVIRAAGNAIIAAGWLTLTDAVALTAWVYLPRPKTVTRPYPTSVQDGDEDKYLRAIQDALTIAAVYTDDSQVVDGHIHKRYADGRPPGAVIRIAAMTEQGALL